jgi:hypothetical protein
MIIYGKTAWSEPATNPSFQLVCKNHTSGLVRSIGSLTEMKNFVVECDYNIAPFSDEWIGLQTRIAAVLEPFVRMGVYSGRKSVHFWVTVNDHPLDHKLYHRHADMLYRYLRLHSINCDRTVLMNPAGWVRNPGAVRDNGVEQAVLFASEHTVSMRDFEREMTNAGITPAFFKARKDFVAKAVDNAEVKILVDIAAYKSESSPRHGQCFWLVNRLREKGVGLEAANLAVERFVELVNSIKPTEYKLSDALRTLEAVYTA